MNLGFKFHVKEGKATFGGGDIRGRIRGIFDRLKENLPSLIQICLRKFRACGM